MQLFFEGCKSKTIIEDSKIFSILTCLCYDKILGLNYIYESSVQLSFLCLKKY